MTEYMMKASARSSERISKTWTPAIVCCVLLSVPFLAVTYPPITDLPQQSAQIRLFMEAWTNPDGIYRIQWFTPYSLSYALLGLSWTLFGPESAGRVAMLIIGLLWIVAIHASAISNRRSVSGAVIASFFFSIM